MIEPLIEAYLAQQWDRPVAVTGLRRFHGGAARETYRFDADGEALVLRRDPPSSLIETDRRTEFEAIRHFSGTDVPVPEPLFLDTGGALGGPAFIMREVPGVRAAGLLEPDPYGDTRENVGRELFAILGRIHARDPGPLRDILATQTAEARLDHWAAMIDADALGPEPIARAAIRWLRANPLPAGATTIVHGDYRSGNFLVDASNRIAAIVDWELVHLGDPLEDLAWICDPLWAHGSDNPASTIPLDGAIAAWEAASGLTCDRAAFRWWRVFAQLMGLAIWISAGREVASGRNADPVNVFAALYPYRYHNRALARTLRDLAA